MQSGCDATLKRMNRKYDTAVYLESCRRLHKWFDNCGITTDLIVGFPGETEEEFAQTLEFIRKCSFSAMHIFPYSIRKGTVAAKMDGQIQRSIKQCRAKAAAAVAEEMKHAFLASQIGKTLAVLFETEEDGMWQGHSGNYALVHAKGENLHNHVANVLITELKNGILLGNIIV
jgi:threonylcarbamoyladenosine tRNA methylthiotransferase MtaB